MFDYIVVGAGFAGCVLAERLASQSNKKILILEKRNHIAGNAYDSYDNNGILIHNYGPHIFHTKIKTVWDYLSQFTDWNYYQHHVLGLIDGMFVPIPFNLHTIEQIFPAHLASILEEKLIRNFGFNKKVPILSLKEVEDNDLKFLADFIYEKVFLNYTLKQWGIKPEELDPTVTGRVPVYISRDNRYFQDDYQAMPKFGYTKMFEKMLAHPNIKIMLNTDYKELINVDHETGKMTFLNQDFEGQLIYTGPIDSFFNYRFDELPYRSLQFEFEHSKVETYQAVGTVNYPNDYDFTRITEFKHLTGQHSDSTTVVREYSKTHVPEKTIPYYPIKNERNQDLFKLYKEQSRKLENVIFIGRLAEYQYYDMDAVVAKALKIYEEIRT